MPGRVSVSIRSVLITGAVPVAMVTGARQTNALMNHNPLIELDLLVTMPSGVPVGTLAIGNPGAVAYDSKRDQLLVPN